MERSEHKSLCELTPKPAQSISGEIDKRLGEGLEVQVIY